MYEIKWSPPSRFLGGRGFQNFPIKRNGSNGSLFLVSSFPWNLSFLVFKFVHDHLTFLPLPWNLISGMPLPPRNLISGDPSIVFRGRQKLHLFPTCGRWIPNVNSRQCRPTPTLRIGDPTLDTSLHPDTNSLIPKSTPDIMQNTVNILFCILLRPTILSTFVWYIVKVSVTQMCSLNSTKPLADWSCLWRGPVSGFDHCSYEKWQRFLALVDTADWKSVHCVLFWWSNIEVSADSHC